MRRIVAVFFAVAMICLLVVGAISAQEVRVELCGQVKNGRLVNISRRVPGQGDVILAAMPLGVGDLKYDAGTKTAVPITDADRTDAEKIATLVPATSEEMGALFVVLSSKASAESKVKAQAIVDARATVITTKAGW